MLPRVLQELEKTLPNAVRSAHFLKQYADRELQGMAEALARQEIIGILAQTTTRFKLWLAYTSDKDLNIVIEHSFTDESDHDMADRHATEEAMRATSSYDYHADAFSVAARDRVYALSVDDGELIFDLDKTGRIVGLEILDASAVLDIPKEVLRSREHVRVSVCGRLLRLCVSVRARCGKACSPRSGSLLRACPRRRSRWWCERKKVYKFHFGLFFVVYYWH